MESDDSLNESLYKLPKFGNRICRKALEVAYPVAQQIEEEAKNSAEAFIKSAMTLKEGEVDVDELMELLYAAQPLTTAFQSKEDLESFKSTAASNLPNRVNEQFPVLKEGEDPRPIMAYLLCTMVCLLERREAAYEVKGSKLDQSRKELDLNTLVEQIHLLYNMLLTLEDSIKAIQYESHKDAMSKAGKKGKLKHIEQRDKCIDFFNQEPSYSIRRAAFEYFENLPKAERQYSSKDQLYKAVREEINRRKSER